MLPIAGVCWARRGLLPVIGFGCAGPDPENSAAKAASADSALPGCNAFSELTASLEPYGAE